MNHLLIRPLHFSNERYTFEVPASKSILNRAFLLAALSEGDIFLRFGDLSKDTRTFLSCLSALGVPVKEETGGMTIGKLKRTSGEIDVGSAGTAARFLTVALAFLGGDYRITSSEQMKKRPMEVIPLLRELGVEIVCEEGKDSFPFHMRSDGIKKNAACVSTDKSSQYASAILMAAGFSGAPFTLTLTGSRTDGSYIGITLNMLEKFGIPFQRKGNEITVFPQKTPPKEYEVEPDLSGACYFYALSLLHSAKVLVKGVHADTLQGDFRFLKLLEEKGVRLSDQEEGILADGSNIKSFDGFDVVMTDFSDQTMTVAALAPFATSPSVLRGVGHIRFQECDRMQAICENLTALGIGARHDGENIFISPDRLRPAAIRTHDDHRVAMSFALVGTKYDGVRIENPDCCKKTFENFFAILNSVS